MKAGMVLALLLLPILAGEVRAAAQAQASSREGGFVVYASENAEADTVRLEAERIQSRFHQLFGLTVSSRASPMVLVIGGVENGPPADRGVVRVYHKGPWIKIQVNWDETPVSGEVLEKAWVRALCVRCAVDQWSDSQRQQADLRMPIWVAEGIAALVAEPSVTEETFGRATLLARTERDLSLDGVLAELEGRSELDRDASAIAAVLCRALTQNPAGRGRLLSALSWDVKMIARDWVAKVGDIKDLDTWWRGVWKGQAAQLSWVKLGYEPTLCHLAPPPPRAGDAEDGSRVDDNGKTPNETAIDTIAHPWFRELFRKRMARDRNPVPEVDTAELCKNAELRRAAALSWYCRFLERQPPLSRRDFLDWYVLQGPGRNVDSAGPVSRWFNTVVPPKAKKVPRKSTSSS